MKVSFLKVLVGSLMASSTGANQIMCVESLREQLNNFGMSAHNISNEEIQNLISETRIAMSQLDQLLLNSIGPNQIAMTCGAGSHGGDRDPVRKV